MQNESHLQATLHSLSAPHTCIHARPACPPTYLAVVVCPPILRVQGGMFIPLRALIMLAGAGTSACFTLPLTSSKAVPRGKTLLSSTTPLLDESGLGIAELKQKIMDEALGTSNGLKATPEQKEIISSSVNKLVSLNPPVTPSCSTLATGTWDLLYTTTSGASGGKLGPFIGKVRQMVDVASLLYVNYVEVGPLLGELEATWEVMNDTQWKVIFKTIKFSLWGLQLIEKEIDNVGIWTLMYLDQNMRVLSARSTERTSGNMYILVKSSTSL
ncbi:unnamed protein product [Choristocarpus tenellus]